MVDSVAEEVLNDTMQDLIMKDILLEIIQNNEVSKMVDIHVDEDRIANFFAEGIMNNTVRRMLRDDVAQPLLTVADSEKSILSSAIAGQNLKHFAIIDFWTKEVAQDCINEELARKVYETSIE